MKTRFSLLLAALCGLDSLAPLHAQNTAFTAFTYQGRLTANGAPANGSHDFQFTLFGAESGGSPVESPVTLSAVGVTNGVFTVPLNFGSNVFTGAERWLDIAVRPADGGTLIPLSPRQPLTPTPYALTALNALNVPGVDRHALHAQAGNPANAVFVNNDGKVGIGTTLPVTKLHVASVASEDSPPRLQSPGTDGFAAGWDCYHGATGKGYVGVPDPNASIAPGEMILFGGAGTRASVWGGGVRALTADTAGNVEVRGGIRMGPGGEIRAAGGEENLRIVRGTVDEAGNITVGSGFTASHIGPGRFGITFNSAFVGPPVVTAMTDLPSGVTIHAAEVNRAVATLWVISTPENNFVDRPFHFIAIGPR